MSGAYSPPVFSNRIDLDLSKNEGRPGPGALSVVAADLVDGVSKYPDVSNLRRALAARIGVAAEQVLVTAGGDDALLRCFLSHRGGPVVSTNPTFEMIRRYAEQTGCALLELDWWEGPFPIDGFLAAAGDGDMAVIVSPNNPTGAVISRADLESISRVFDLVVLDAAYAEFSDDDLTSRALELGNVVVIRTLSKAFGLAGLRVGYLVGPAGLIERMAGFGNPYPVSVVSAEGALRAITDGAVGRGFVDAVRAERVALAVVLDSIGAVALPSQGNFVLARFVNAAWVVSAAASLGVGLRVFPERAELAGYVRITLPGEASEFRRLVATLEKAVSPEALLFDLDGVLADVSQSYRVAIVRTAAGFGVDVTPEMIVAAKEGYDANDDWELTRGLCARAGVEVPLETIRDEFEKIYQGDGDEEGLKAREALLLDVEDLARLADRLPLGIVTGRPRKDALEFLDRYGVAGYFGVVVTREDGPMKPDPHPVRQALAALGVERAWMLGDTRDDLAAARAAGVLPIGVVAPGNQPERSRKALAEAAVVLDATAQILEVLNAANS